MIDLQNLKFNPALPHRQVCKVFELLTDLDRFLAMMQVTEQIGFSDAKVQRLLEVGPDAATGQRVYDQLVNRVIAPGYKMTPEDAENFFNVHLLMALHLALHALLADTLEDSYDYLFDARDYFSYAEGLACNLDEGLIRSELASKAARAANASRNEPHKAAILTWYAENRDNYKSIESAASAAIKLEPVSQRTAAKWISAWCKENPKS